MEYQSHTGGPCIYITVHWLIAFPVIHNTFLPCAREREKKIEIHAATDPTHLRVIALLQSVQRVTLLDHSIGKNIF